MAGTSLLFNSYDMNSTTVITSQIQDAQTPDRNLSIFNLVRRNGAVISDSQYYTKTIRVSGKLVAASNTALETLIDTFNYQMTAQDKNLDIGYAGATRRYVCTPAVVSIERDVRGANWASFAVDFIATEYGKDTATTTLVSAVTHTTTTSSPSLALVGSAPEQFVTATIVVTAATGLTNKTIKYKNNTSGQEIAITRTWTVGESLVIDPAAKTVKVNGVNVEFTGAFPIFPPTTTTAVITNDFTTRTLTVTLAYIKRYL